MALSQINCHPLLVAITVVAFVCKKPCRLNHIGFNWTAVQYFAV